MWMFISVSVSSLYTHIYTYARKHSSYLQRRQRRQGRQPPAVVLLMGEGRGGEQEQGVVAQIDVAEAG